MSWWGGSQKEGEAPDLLQPESDPDKAMAAPEPEDEDGDKKDEVPELKHDPRGDLLQQQLKSRRAMSMYMDGIGTAAVTGTTLDSTIDPELDSLELDEKAKEELRRLSHMMKDAIAVVKRLEPFLPKMVRSIEVRLRDLSYYVPLKLDDSYSGKVRTVYNQSAIYMLVKWCQNIHYQWGKHRESIRLSKRNLANEMDEDLPLPPTHKPILKNANLVLKPGKMYLVLGPPASGKTTLLKAIASLLPGQKYYRKRQKKGQYEAGSVEYNGLSIDNNTGHIFSNAIAYVDQIDRHAPRLSVKETFDFAFQCKSGGTHFMPGMKKCPELDAIIQELDETGYRVSSVMDFLGLTNVADTFVGDATVRGISGGQRRRVTCGEMFQWGAPVFCADEISNGLDAASTYDIVSSLLQFTRLTRMTRVVSLLQPSPETFALFDEVMLLMDGNIIYAGAVDKVVEYFSHLGYALPDIMDAADFLQMIPTKDGEDLFKPNELSKTPYTVEQFVQAFNESEAGKKIQEELDSPYKYDWRKSDAESKSFKDEETGAELENTGDFLKEKYRNSFMISTWLNLKRHYMIWWRDKRFIIANIIKNVVMGMSVGAVFWQTDSTSSIFGVLFQGTLFIMLGAMTSAPGQLLDRSIFYRHKDANFYPTFSYVIGRAFALVPQSTTDIIVFGSILYWMVGLTANAGVFFIFIFVLIAFSLVMTQQLSIFASLVPTSSALQGISSFIILLHMLFCGFIVSPDVIPNYYLWLYWWNPLAWAYRCLVVNEFTSSDWDGMETIQNITMTSGDFALLSFGFTKDNEPYGKEWVGYAFAYLLPYLLICTFLVGIGLMFVRMEGAAGNPKNDDIIGQADDATQEDIQDETTTKHMDLPFTPVDLTFENISYEVKASKGGGTLKLLNNVSGKLASGRMCALMGSSGAGKTTLMDVIALRKASGKVTGEVRLNGHSQEKKTFRRCSGYVEQFDIQSPELTVRETILFSAYLRLEHFITDDMKVKFVDQIIEILELGPIKNDVVGTDEEGGLSFEEKKRLSIAVELAASPSIIFLDEPTSGLDSRAALLVMRSLKRITDTGRTVCATIHQPSSAIFEMFNDLLLLKKGGEVVFFGELGHKSSSLVNYFESNGGPKKCFGENPATWMLTVIGAGTSGDDSVDFAKLYRGSEHFKNLNKEIETAKLNPEDAKKITYDSEYARNWRDRNILMSKRLRTIYWRSPTYNLARLMISIVVAFLLGSVFITQRNPSTYTETQLNSLFSTIFISFIIIGVMAQVSVLPVMLLIRDVFYRHRAAGMLNYGSLGLALGTAEKWFILLSSTLFCLVFYFTIGLNDEFKQFFGFWGFFTFNLAIYSYFGQAFMSCVKGMPTASILCSVFIGINNLFSGLIVRPQYLSGFWSITYWICPGHYVFEGLIVTQFADDTTPVQAFPGSEFYYYLGCTDVQETACPPGTVEQYVDSFFGGKFDYSHIKVNGIVLGVFLVISRVFTCWALKRFNYVST